MTNFSKIKNQKRLKRRKRTRSKIFGSSQKPRLSVFRSLKHISAQLIDDTKSRTILAAHDRELSKSDLKKKKSEIAGLVGEMLAKKALDKKISSVVFDRSYNKFHGRVKALAEGARKGGLKF